MTQQQLAEAVGVSMRTVGNWERGRPPRAKLGAIETVLHVKLRHPADGNSPTLTEATDTEIYSELARRSAAQQRRIDELTSKLRELHGGANV